MKQWQWMWNNFLSELEDREVMRQISFSDHNRHLWELHLKACIFVNFWIHSRTDLIGCCIDSLLCCLVGWLVDWLNVLVFSQEEFEDSAGNVVTKKIYEDLRRQGLLWTSGQRSLQTVLCNISKTRTRMNAICCLESVLTKATFVLMHTDSNFSESVEVLWAVVL